MPFSTMPKDSPAFKIWEKVHDQAKKGGDDDETAAKKAWGAVKNAGYEKQGDKWVKKSNAVVELSMAFTAVPFDKGTGEMRWRATASDTGKDSFDEQMTTELYRSFISKIQAKDLIPEAFRSLVESSYWKGGMPYLSVSHYPDLDGAGVPGIPSKIYIDGEKFKGTGKFFDTALGRACYKAILKDKSESVPNPIRLSIAFLDLAHRHGDGPVWTRKSTTDICPECAEGVPDKKYVDGYLVHWALTRVPANSRAEIEVDKSMAEKKVTRLEDATSVIGDPEMAKQLEEKAALIGRSEALVELSDADKPKADEVPATPEVEKAANTMPLPKQIRDDDLTYLPYGGTKALEQITHVWDRQGAKESLDSVFKLLEETMSTIFTRDIGSKQVAIHGVAEELKNIVQLKPESGIKQSVLAEPVKALVDMVVTAKSMADKTAEEKLIAIQPAMDALGEAIRGEIQQMPIEEGDEMAGPDEKTIKKWIAEAIANQAISKESMAVIDAKLDQLINQSPYPNKSTVRIPMPAPRPRSISPALAQKAKVEAELAAAKTGVPGTKPLHELVRKSVGLQ